MSPNYTLIDISMDINRKVMWDDYRGLALGGTDTVARNWYQINGTSCLNCFVLHRMFHGQLAVFE